MSFLAELKRRNVIRMAGLYLVGAWLIVQVAGTILPMFGAPEWVARTVVILLAIGFVPALVISWAFELTPEGLKRDGEVTNAESIAPQTARRMDRMLLVIVTLALAYFALDKFVLAPTRIAAIPVAGSSTATVPESQSVTDKSIAVLPFADFSAQGDQGWFADGLAEEILNALARTPDLLVSARTSSFRYKGSELAIPQIAKELGVAHVLEGSVRSTSERIRVTAQLIRAADGFQLWSQTYDRDPADMIEIQEDLARQIAQAMQTSMDPAALSAMAKVGTRSVEAYQAYIRAVALSLDSSIDVSDRKRSYAYLEQARTLDPNFAAAHARSAEFWLRQLEPTYAFSGMTGETPEHMAQLFSERIELAIAHAATTTDRLGYRAQKARRESRFREALELSQALLAERPGDHDALDILLRIASQIKDRELGMAALDELWPQAVDRPELAQLFVNHAYRILDRRKAADRAEELVKRWPDLEGLLYQAHRTLLWDQRVEVAATVASRVQSLSNGEGRWDGLLRARQACAEGRRVEAETLLAQVPESELSQRWQLLMMLGRQREAVESLQPLERAGNTFALASFLVHPEFDPTPFPSLMKILEREKVQRTPELAPFACPAQETR